MDEKTLWDAYRDAVHERRAARELAEVLRCLLATLRDKRVLDDGDVRRILDEAAKAATSGRDAEDGTATQAVLINSLRTTLLK